MSACSVFGCKNYARKTRGVKNVRYFSFPKDKNMAKKWIKVCKRSDKINVKTARVCSDHFSEECYFISLKQRLLKYSYARQRTLTPDAIPTVNLPFQVNPSKPKSDERSERFLKRCRRKIVADLLANEATVNRIHVENPTKQVWKLEDERDKPEKQCSILTAEKKALPVEFAQNKKNIYLIKVENPKKQVKQLEEEQDKCKKQCSSLTAETEALPVESAQSKKNDYQIRVENLKKQVQQLEEERDEWRNQCSVLTAVKKALSLELAQSEKNVYQIEIENLKKQVKQLEEEQDKWKKQCTILAEKKKALSVELDQSKKCIFIISSNTQHQTPQKSNSYAQKRKVAQESALQVEEISKKTKGVPEPSQQT